jgi:bifunctional non-homologous end joining protein LigD
VIPEGQYGAGAAILWDRGRFRPEEDPVEGVRRGVLVFTLAGRKLKGGWVLARLDRRGRDGERAWLLTKRRDAHARTGAAAEVSLRMPRSVRRGKRVVDRAPAAAPARRGRLAGARRPARGRRA